MRTKIVLVVILLALGSSTTVASLFRVLESPLWSGCKAINETQTCYRSRETVCVRTSDNRTAPWYYCLDVGLERPSSVELCEEGSCVQDCVVSEWSEWSDCNCAKAYYSTRTRQLVAPPRNGGAPCPALLERQPCQTCFNNGLFPSLPRQYTWRTGSWGACNALDSTSGCGSGLQNRAVDCIGSDGRKADLTKCLDEVAYSSVNAPPTSRLCSVSCDCVVGEWSPWSPCQSICDTPTPHTAEIRSRTLTRLPSQDGADCPPLIETRECSDLSLPSCPTYFWTTSDWTLCEYNGDAECGNGHMTRFLYCVMDNNSTEQYVDLRLCDTLASAQRPAVISPCQAECPQACVVGAWSPWSECVPSCEPTYSNRTRDILVTPHGDEACPHTTELKTCPTVPCAQYVPEDFSNCYLSDKMCGVGVQSRNIRCKDPLGRDIPYEQCAELVLPENTQDCYVPCPHDCVVSDWTPWTPCTQTCEEEHGTQTRTRRLIAVGTNCTYSDEDLLENRTCVSPMACEPPSYHVEMGPWSECRDGPMSSGDSPNSLVQFDGLRAWSCDFGVRNRSLHCMLGDSVVPQDECPIVFSPSEEESCELSCDQECMFSPWSDFSRCSVSCGTGIKTRSRILIKFPEDPQRTCLADEDGMQVETETCVMPECPLDDYEWAGGDWGECVLFPSIDSTACGLGYQTTPLTCVHNLIEVVNKSLCSHLPPPATARACVEPCPDRCTLTEWTEFTTCENGSQNRTRQLIPHSGAETWENSCPQLAPLPLIETAPCTGVDLQRFDYSIFGRFSPTFIEDPLAVCGNGREYRLVACIDMSRFPVQAFDEEFCAGREKPDAELPASIKCDVDCVQSEWSGWSSCSSSCGYGSRSRTRMTLRWEQEEGRVCGASEEVEVCFTQPCLYTQYKPGPYSICQVSNSSTICGSGTRTRQALCVVNGVVQDTAVECERQGAQVNFKLSESCVMPCPGECVVSEWSEWSPCPTDCMPGACQHSRTRSVLRAGSLTMECMLTQQFEFCEAEGSLYEWSVGEWGGCVVGVVNTEISAGVYCGAGIHRRAVQCVDSLNQTVYDGLCEGDKPDDVAPCSVPCPVDCVVGPFSDWTTCPQRCELRLEQTRQREVITPPLSGGRQCPETEQARSCPPANCTMYTVEEGRGSRCDLDFTPATQCGSATVSKPLSCHRNTQYVDFSVCLEAIETRLDVVGSELVTPEPCNVDCPLVPACTYSDWSSFSECTSLCIDSSARFRFRTRALISSRADSRDESECESMQYEVLECEMLEPTSSNSTHFNQSDCISFEWSSSEFNVNGTRVVQCVTGSDMAVSAGGCPTLTRPPPTLSCDQTKCPAFSSCVGERCVCRPGYEGVVSSCLPVSGCGDHTHCLYPNMECMNGECVCKQNYKNTNGRCTYIGPPTTPTSLITTTTNDDNHPTTSVGTDVIQTSDSTSEARPTSSTPSTTSASPPTETGRFGIVEIVLISTVPLIVIIFVVTVLIIIMYRCRRKLEQEQRAEKRRDKITISAPSPVHSLDRYCHHRGGDSASSGFVDDLEHDPYKYGMAGKTFLGSQRMVPSSREDIDEAAFSAEFPAQAPPSPNIRPVPVAVPSLPGYQLQHIALDYRPRDVPTDVPDGDFTTDITYTTDDGSIVTTSVPPSSAGSPNVSRRHLPPHVTAQSPNAENTYVSMHPIYSQVTPRSQRSQRSHDRSLEESHDYQERLQSYGSPTRSRDYPGSPTRSHDYPGSPTRSHDYRERLQSSGSPTRSQDYRGRLQSNSSYDYREYRDMSHDNGRRSHDPRQRSHSAGKEYRVYEHERERYYNNSEHSPHTPHGPHSPHYSRQSRPRDRGIATGLDNSLVQAISQIEGRGATPSTSVRSAGSRGSQRRRRRRYQGQPHHMTYHHSSQYRYNSDGPSDYDQTSASETEQVYHSRQMPSRSLPISPLPPDPNEPDYDTLPPPHVRVSPATPRSRRVASPDHTHQLRVSQLKSQRTQEGHYDYPRCFQQPPPQERSLHSPPPPPASQSTPSQESSCLTQSSTTSPVPPPTQTVTVSPPSHVSQPNTPNPPKATRYEHLAPLKLSPVEGSPLSARKYPPSPLALHSEGRSGLHISSDITTFHPPQESHSQH